MKINRLFVSETFFRLIKRYCFGIHEAKYNLGKVKTKPMQRCCLGYLGGSREVCRGIAMCFGLSCLFACLLLLGSGKFVYSLVPTLISFRRTVLPRVSSALSGFMPPKRLLLIHLPCQQCRRLVCPPARLHHVLHLFPWVCQPHWFRHPFSSHSLLGPDSHRFLTK